MIKTVTLANIKCLILDFFSIFDEALSVINCNISSDRVCISVAREYEILASGEFENEIEN